MNNEEKILDLLSQMQKQLNELDKKVDANHSEVIGELIEINGEIKNMKSDMSRIEMNTADNWKDIARLKSIK